MADSSGNRNYRSPLREAQTEQTRVRILDALAEMVADDGFDGIVVKDLAARAGMSERTIYRHFPDRDALHDGLADRIAERAGWTAEPGPDDGGLDALPAVMAAVYRDFDDQAQLVTVAARLNAVRARVSADTDRRRERIRDFIRAGAPDLDDDDIADLLAVFQLLGSSRTWLRLREEHGFDGERSGALVAWLLRLAVADVRRHGGIPRPDPPIGALEAG